MIPRARGSCTLADGRRLAFRRFGADGSNLVVLDVATGTKSVSTGKLRISGLSWALTANDWSPGSGAMDQQVSSCSARTAHWNAPGPA
jgi:hypothetical protein